MCFAQEVKPCLQGRAFLVRYADDFVLGFACEEDARRVLGVLPKRFGKYGLTIHPDKTRLVPCRRPPSRPAPPGAPAVPPPGSFDFLGFTHFWSRSPRGHWVVKRKTAGSRFHRAIKALGGWCRLNRPLPIGAPHRVLCLKLRGHFLSYGGVIGNVRCLQRFRSEAVRLWRTWLSRRQRRGTLLWARFNGLLKVFPLPWPASWVPPCAARP